MFQNSLSQQKHPKQKNNKHHHSIEEDHYKFVLNLKKNDCFGQQGFLTGFEKIVKASSTKFTTIITISREELINIIKDNKKEFQKFQEIKDKILLNNDYSDLKISCQCCLSVDHETIVCPATHISKDPQYLCILKNNQLQQERQRYENRQKRKPFNSMLQQLLVHEDAYRLAIDYGFLNMFDGDNENYDEYDDDTQIVNPIDVFGPQVQTAEYILPNSPLRSKMKIQNEDNKLNFDIFGYKPSKDINKFNKNVEENKSFTSTRDFKIEEKYEVPESKRDQNYFDKCLNTFRTNQFDDDAKDKQAQSSIKVMGTSLEQNEQEIETNQLNKLLHLKNNKRCSIDSDINIQNKSSQQIPYVQKNELIARNLSNGLYDMILQFLNKDVTSQRKITHINLKNKQQQKPKYTQNTQNVENKVQSSFSQLNNFEEVIQRRAQNRQKTLKLQKSVNFGSLSVSKNIPFQASSSSNKDKDKKLQDLNLLIEQQILEEIFFNDTDQMFFFENYFPQFNFKYVLEQFSQIQKKFSKSSTIQKKGALLVKRKKTLAKKMQTKSVFQKAY